MVFLLLQFFQRWFIQLNLVCSPVGIQPPVTNTILQSFDKQRVAINKAAVKAGLHADTKNRIIQFLAPPPSHQDPLRVMPVDQLAALSDPHLVHQALQLLTTANVGCVSRIASSSSRPILNHVRVAKLKNS